MKFFAKNIFIIQTKGREGTIGYFAVFRVMKRITNLDYVHSFRNV